MGTGFMTGLGFSGVIVAIARTVAAALHTASVVCAMQIGQTIYFLKVLQVTSGCFRVSSEKRNVFIDVVSSTWCTGSHDVACIIII
jgi:hypothetical protein